MIRIINRTAVFVGFKRRGWCLWHYLNEAGLITLQVGPLIFEIYC